VSAATEPQTSVLDGHARAGFERSLAGGLAVLVMLGACGPSPRAAPAKLARDQANEISDLAARSEPPRAGELAPPDVHLLAFACAGFDLAVADQAPPDRLLSHAAARAVELGGAPVEAATQRWALLPPRALLEEVQHYAATSEAGPDACAGLRAHLERLAMLSGSH
jgi:hypothetical protein